MSNYDAESAGDDRDGYDTGRASYAVNSLRGGRPENRESRARGVIDLVNRQRDELMKLSEVVSMLSDRVEPLMVRRDDEKPTGNYEDSSDPGHSDLAREIVNNTETVQGIARRLNGLISRVDL